MASRNNPSEPSFVDQFVPCHSVFTPPLSVLTSIPPPPPPPQAAHTPVAPVGSPVGSSLSLIPEDGLPPILISTGVKGGTGGHITGACPHPHHSAASSLFRQPPSFCPVAVCVLFICHGSRYPKDSLRPRWGLGLGSEGVFFKD